MSTIHDNPGGFPPGLDTNDDPADPPVDDNDVDDTAADAGDDAADTGGDDAPKSSSKKKGGGNSSKRRSRGSKNLTSEANRALRVAATLAFTDDERRDAVAEVVNQPVSGDPEEALVAVAEGALTVNKLTEEELKSLDELVDIDSQIKVGIQLGAKSRSALRELHRLACVLSPGEADELPKGDDAPIAVAERISEVDGDLLDWVRDLTSP